MNGFLSLLDSGNEDFEFDCEKENDYDVDEDDNDVYNESSDEECKYFCIIMNTATIVYQLLIA